MSKRSTSKDLDLEMRPVIVNDAGNSAPVQLSAAGCGSVFATRFLLASVTAKTKLQSERNPLRRYEILLSSSPYECSSSSDEKASRSGNQNKGRITPQRIPDLQSKRNAIQQTLQPNPVAEFADCEFKVLGRNSRSSPERLNMLATINSSPKTKSQTTRRRASSLSVMKTDRPKSQGRQLKQMKHALIIQKKPIQEKQQLNPSTEPLKRFLAKLPCPPKQEKPFHIRRKSSIGFSNNQSTIDDDVCTPWSIVDRNPPIFYDDWC